MNKQGLSPGVITTQKAGAGLKLVQICSPYRGNVRLNTLSAQRYCQFAYSQGVIPFAPHLHNTQFLDESIREEREAGIRMGIEMLGRCDELWVFGGLFTEGMEMEIKTALRMKKPVRCFTNGCEEVTK